MIVQGRGIYCTNRLLDHHPDLFLPALVFNTRMLSLDYDAGLFGGEKEKFSLLLNVHNLSSDGYQTYNFQDRWAGSAKYQYKLSDKTVLTAFTGVVDLASNTPNVKGPTRAQVAQFGDNYLLNNNPNDRSTKNSTSTRFQRTLNMSA